MIEKDIPVTLFVLDRIRAVCRLTIAVESVIYILIGIAWVYQPNANIYLSLEFTEIISVPLVGYVWIATALLSMVFVNIRRKNFSKIAFFLMTMVPMVTSFYFLISWLLYFVPFFDGGFPKAINSSLIYGAIGIFSYFISRLFSMTVLAKDKEKGNAV